MERRGLMLVLSAPSGTGKSSVTAAILSADPRIAPSVSATTRPPRPGERDGADYHFVSAEGFADAADAGGFLETATVFGNRYGTPAGPVRAALAAGGDVLLDVDWQGLRQLASTCPRGDIVSVFILPPSLTELDRRLRARGTDSPETIARRMAEARDQISHCVEYDHVVVNADLDECVASVRAILAAERTRRARLAGLERFVAAL
jgi:guanylate kinase